MQHPYSFVLLSLQNVNMHFHRWSPLDDNTKALPNRALADLNIKAQCFSNVFSTCRFPE